MAQGETLDFIVDIHGGLSYDSFAWSPTIVELPAARSATAPESAVDVKSTAIADSSPPKSWNYSEQFRQADPIPMTPLQSLAQVLLMSNEFHFVD